jgi:hypothetical protein
MKLNEEHPIGIDDVEGSPQRKSFAADLEEGAGLLAGERRKSRLGNGTAQLKGIGKLAKDDLDDEDDLF